ncbi:3-oxoacyl-[acyl-carrier-protein] reductase [Effusibacillus lacus]|uniref:3-oxoacyl-[acyl-carrier-protein] reductase n=1 Tax=Effusibacillus lacus TaxID=1348429 RepID=A0A292YNB5_9BACL|nr:3-oxoacyl-[acyl-carrier-protein] reductase [Effusibacillus lacus]TCS76583.1 3-oxoacyl-[acyl-carrier-protein] reductase [Effusibacillus lacus]GAX90401.1 beta-ketoacyl-ACP reductase [Effusibacillus lacus]
MVTGKVALVTGASRGIGRAVALELARRGAKLVVNYAGNQSAAEEVVAKIREMGGEAVAVQGNVASPEDADRMVNAATEAFGRLDILVNNAGITRDNLLIRMKEEDWDSVIDTNLKGVFNTTKAAARIMMKQRYGRIINVTSVVALMGNPGQANYVAAKSGVIGLTKSNARELASRNITVNAVAPGYIQTDMTAVLNDDVKETLSKQIPLGRLGDPEDIAKVVAFLASDDASYMTGQVLTVDGGMVM